ncbi:hypothetical protein G7Y79_00005g016330 [Physcia stellaris]|nr:hypothetical protein G7Y79_00005g016330 [Physcia stellaris]
MWFMSKPSTAIKSYERLNVKGQGRFAVFMFVRADQPDPNPGAVLEASTGKTDPTPAASNNPTPAASNNPIPAPSNPEDVIVRDDGVGPHVGAPVAPAAPAAPAPNPVSAPIGMPQPTASAGTAPPKTTGPETGAGQFADQAK